MAGLHSGHIGPAAPMAGLKTFNLHVGGENGMYSPAKGEDICVIDGHTQFWDGSPANQKNIQRKQFIECFYAYHSNLSPPSEKWEKEKFEKYDAKTMYDDLFIHGYDD